MDGFISLKKQRKAYIALVLLICVSILLGCSNSKDKVKETDTQPETKKIEKTEKADLKTTTPKNEEGKDDTMNTWSTPAGFDAQNDGVKYGDLKEVSYNSTTTGTTRKCFVITPAGYDKAKKYPVLYLLHGIGGIHTEWLGGNPVNVIGNLIAAGEASDMVVVIPNVRAAANDSVPKDILSSENIAAFDNFINDLKNDLMPFINKNYSVSTKWEDTAIAGLSMGGRESLFIGFTMSDTFSYIGAFSPAPGLLPNSGLNYPGQFSEKEFVIPAGQKTPKLILICSGNNDRMIGDVPTTYHQTLEKNSVEHLWYTMPGDHDFVVWKNGLYNFVKKIFK